MLWWVFHQVLFNKCYNAHAFVSRARVCFCILSIPELSLAFKETVINFNQIKIGSEDPLRKSEKQPKFHLRMRWEGNRTYISKSDQFASDGRRSSSILNLSGICILLIWIGLFMCYVKRKLLLFSICYTVVHKEF